MSEFPPPNVGPVGPGGGETPAQPSWSPVPPPPPPPQPPGAVLVPGPPPGGYGYQPNAPSSGSKRGGKIVVGLVIVAALAAGGVYLATRDSDSDSTSSETSTAPTEETEATEAPETTVAATEPATVETEAPVTTEVATTEAPTTTEASTTTAAPTTTTTTFVVPDGAIDLGHDVYLPVPSGWTQTNDPDAPTLITDGTTKFGVQVLARDPGEDIEALVQEYTDTFDTAYGATSFGPTRFVGPAQAPTETNEYVTFYTTYDAGDAVGLTGTIDTFVRADGLSVVVDVFSPSSSAFTLPQDAYDTMVASLGAAPLLGPTAPLAAHEPFRVTSVTPVAIVDGLVGFSVAPGFTVFTQGAPGSPFAQVTTGVEDFSVIKVTGQADINTVIAAAQTNLSLNYGNVAYEAATADPADSFGVLHGAFTWTGVYLDGQPSAGSINYYFDPATANAYVAYRTWFTAAGPGEPSIPEGEFMLRSLYSSITTIP